MKHTLMATVIVTTATVLFFIAGMLFEARISHAATRSAVITLTYQQEAFLGALEWCESRGDPEAINPKDSDGTPSYGITQFKPGTYALFAKAYGLASTTNFMNPIEQQQIVAMMIKNGVDLARQFPACVRKLGTPPQAIAIDR